MAMIALNTVVLMMKVRGLRGGLGAPVDTGSTPTAWRSPLLLGARAAVIAWRPDRLTLCSLSSLVVRGLKSKKVLEDTGEQEGCPSAAGVSLLWQTGRSSGARGVSGQRVHGQQHLSLGSSAVRPRVRADAEVSEHVFTSMFSMECVLKIIAFGCWCVHPALLAFGCLGSGPCPL